MSTRQRLTLVATGLGMFMVFLDALIVNVALPDLQSEFSVGESGVQAVVTSYSIGMAITIMWSATMADLRGRRLVYLASVVVFTLASILSGSAPDFSVLVIGRTIQGLAAGSITVSSLAVLSAAFDDDKQRTFALGIWTGIASVGTALGPPIGGLLVDGPGWRSVFFVNVPVGIAAVLLTFTFVAESRDPSSRTFDYSGQIFFALGIAAFAAAIIGAPQWGWLSAAAIGLFVVALASGAAFVVRERSTSDPMMDLTLFRNRVYSTGLVILFVFFFVVYGILLLVTQYFQNIQGDSATEAGLLILPFALGLLIFSPLAGVIVRRVGRRVPVMWALVVQPLSVIGIAVGIGRSEPLLAVSLFGSGMASALALTPLTGLSMASVVPERGGMASGIMSTQRAIGSTAGFAVLGSILALYVSANIDGDLTTVVPNARSREMVSEAIEDAANPSSYAAELAPGRELVFDRRVDQNAVLDVADDVFVRGMQIALAVGVGLLVASLVLGYRIFPNDKPEARGPPEGAARSA